MSKGQSKPEPTSPPTDEPRRGWVVAAVVALAVAAGAAVFTELFNYDIFWHLASGDWMLAHGRVLGTDPFSIEPMGQWVNVHWLFQVIISALHAVGGFAGLVGLKTILAIATIVVLALACRREAPVAWIILAGLLAVVVLESRMRVRPEAFTLFFLTATIALVESVRRGAAARRLWLLPAMMLPWANMHGMYILGPAVFWSALAGTAIDRALGRAMGGNLATRRAMWPMLAASAVCFVTPWPIQAAIQPLLLWTRISGETEAFTYGVLEFIPTWQSGYFLYIAMALLVPTVIACVLNSRRVPMAHLLWLAAFGVLAIMARRNVALTAPVCGYLLTIHGGQVIRRFFAASRARSLAGAANVAAIALAMAVAGGCATELLFRLRGFDRRFGTGLYQPYFPIDIASRLGSLEARGDILCDNWGDAGTFIYHSRPRKLWMDGRLEAHTLERFKSQGRIAEALRETGSASIVELPPTVRFIYVRGESRRAVTAMARSGRYRVFRVDETGVCFARADYPDRFGDELPPGDNLADFDRPLTNRGDIEGLPANVRHWWRQNPPSRYYPIGATMLWLAWRPPAVGVEPHDRLRSRAGPLAVRYLEAALAEGISRRTTTLGMLAQAYQQQAIIEDITPGETAPIDFCSARALYLYRQLDLRRLDNEDVRAFAEQHVDALVRARRLDAAAVAAKDMLSNAPSDLPADKLATWKGIHDRLEALVGISRQRASDLPAKGISRIRQLASPSVGLADQAIAELVGGSRTPEAETLLGDLLLNAGRVDEARDAYSRAGAKAAWRVSLCDWAAGLFVGTLEMPANSPASARRYEALRRRLIGTETSSQ